VHKVDNLTYHLHVPIALKSERVNLLETVGSVQACTGIVLPSPLQIYDNSIDLYNYYNIVYYWRCIE